MLVDSAAITCVINDWDEMNVLQEFKRKIKVKVCGTVGSNSKFDPRN